MGHGRSNDRARARSISMPQSLHEELDAYFAEVEAELAKLGMPIQKVNRSATICGWIREGMAKGREQLLKTGK